MKQKQINKVVHDRYEKTEALAAKVFSGLGAEDIHAFRVEVKRLRAFLRVARSARDGKLKAGLPARLQAFYQATGVIRNLQLQRTGLARLAKEQGAVLPELFTDLLDQRLRASREEVRKILKKGKLAKKGGRRLIAGLPAEIGSTQRKAFVVIELRSLDPTHRPMLPEEDYLHAFRKSLKDLLYTWHWVKKEADGILPPHLAGKDQIRSVAALIGDFCDLRVLLDFQRQCQFSQEAIGPQEKNFLQRMERQWGKEKEALRLKIYRAIGQTPPLNPGEDYTARTLSDRDRSCRYPETEENSPLR